jgi:integrase
MYTIKSFAEEHGHRIWEEPHLTHSLSKISKLSSFHDFATRPIADYKPADIEAFTDRLSEEGLQNGTINRYLAALSSLFKEAVRKDVVTHVPSIRWKREPKVRPRTYGDSEVKRVLSFLKASRHPWIADFFVFGLNTGMRLGEILGINNPDSKTFGEVSNCGCFVTLFNTKNGDERLVPLNKDAQWALENLRRTPSAFYTEATFYRTWRKAKAEIAPLDKRFVFNVSRHTCCSRLSMEFLTPDLVVAEIMGHRSLATTQKYAHALPKSIQAVMQKLEN